ncbi:ABC transporter ATP-binding protein [Massilia sp. CF038]|uniref:ABC transporter ATP-binding protein n=1 Tax=Massilia sp. CF038 TaxID=1881045 RepID=UPI00091B6321|nr:ABC transporter ATP-binding protein [Massilia sp. CF038]SHH62199.1 sulfonate transport system ATP-binding protein [Massilia sp. CF038]
MTEMLDIFVAEKRYGARQILRDLRLTLRTGEIVALIGASGCGKSTLLSIVAGLDRHYRGQIVLNGLPVQGISADIGFIFQEPRLFPWLSVAQNIAFSKGPGVAEDPLVTELLAEVGLTGYGGALPKQLSGGQAQRVAIARGLYTRPKVLLLDEPFSAVDAFTRIKLQQLLERVAHEHGLTVLLVTHDIDEALFLADRVVLLDNTAGPVRTQFDVDLHRPRKRSDAAGGPLKAAVLQQLETAHAI